MIFNELSEETGFIPQPPPEATYALATYALDDVDTREGENDHLVARTYNGLRPEDEALEQPSQSPEDRY